MTDEIDFSRLKRGDKVHVHSSIGPCLDGTFVKENRTTITVDYDPGVENVPKHKVHVIPCPHCREAGAQYMDVAPNPMRKALRLIAQRASLDTTRALAAAELVRFTEALIRKQSYADDLQAYLDDLHRVQEKRGVTRTNSVSQSVSRTGGRFRIIETFPDEAQAREALRLAETKPFLADRKYYADGDQWQVETVIDFAPAKSAKASLEKGEGLFEDFLRRFRDVLSGSEIASLERAISKPDELTGFDALKRIARRLPKGEAGREAKRILDDEQSL